VSIRFYKIEAGASRLIAGCVVSADWLHHVPS